MDHEFEKHMSNLTITKNADNEIKFDAAIEGLKAEDTSINLVICCEGVNLTFKADQLDSPAWSVKIPPQSSLTKSSYDYFIEVIASEYYFKPITGTVEVVSKAAEVKPTVTITLKSEDKPAEPKKVTERIIPMKHHNLLKSLSDASRERLASKDDTVRDILKNLR